MRATRVRVAAIARGQNARARVDVRRIAETATARLRRRRHRVIDFANLN